MPLDVNALAAEVALAIKNATAPLLERIATLEAKQAVLGDVRDRVVTLEAKAAQPAPEFDMTHLKSPDVDLSPVLNALGDVRDRLGDMEAKATAPVIEPQTVDLSKVWDRFAAVDARLEEKAAALAPISTAVSDLAKEHAVIRERLAVVEVRAQIPGPPGKDGKDGENGQPGKDGVDGVGFDDILIGQDDERTISIKAIRGSHVKDLGSVRFPVEIYRGVFMESKTYERGDGVTWAGSEWHCNETTTSKPGDGSKAWTLKVKRGRDGKDGRDAMQPVPVVSVKR